jgi:aerobic-type carbon monoxide dehydrogenase small subunit (CoxS/CutS family)
MPDQPDLFDEEIDEADQPVTEHGGPSDGLIGTVGRRRFLQTTAGAAAAGTLIGIGGTIGVSALLDDEDDGAETGTTVGATGGTTGGTPPEATAPGAALGVPAGVVVPDAVITLNVNGRDHRLSVEANESLAEVLRRRLGLTGTKISCDRSECSSCTVLVDGVASNACSQLAIRMDGQKVVTIEGLEQGGQLSPVQAAFVEEMGLQCGFCTPGIIMQATALLERNSSPTEAEIQRALSGNLCKCGAYPNIIRSVQSASKKLSA